MAWRKNPGHVPPEAMGKRVHVRLEHEAARDTRRNWPADGKNGCAWQRRGHPFDIAEYEVAS